MTYLPLQKAIHCATCYITTLLCNVAFIALLLNYQLTI